MAVTYYVALTFIRTEDGTAPGEAQECQSEASVGLRIDFLAVEQTAHILLAFSRHSRQCVFGHGQHATRATRAVVKQVGPGLDLIFDRQEYEISHQADGVAWKSSARPLPRCCLH